MSTRCICGCDDYRDVYDKVPYGDTMVSMWSGYVCSQCGYDKSDWVEWCDHCEHVTEECDCERCLDCGEVEDECTCKSEKEMKQYVTQSR